MNSERAGLGQLPRQRMVGWYDPGQLLRTGVEVVISRWFGKHSDARRLDAVAAPAPPFVDYRQSPLLDADGSFGFDYVADTGDGWNSTYAVAHAVSQPILQTANGDSLPRGRLLVFGGDQVYPYATREEYTARLVAPFGLAAELHDDALTDVLAIPGNHDWYDSLVNFRHLFCRQARLPFGQTRQTRSYFAASLPAHWWLLGVDLQLDGDLDELQSDFFAGIAAGLEARDRVILLSPEPYWYKRWAPTTDSRAYWPMLIDQLEKQLGDHLRIRIAGDLHHYQRHSSADDRHVITCGTGGAFLHPTHATPDDPTGEFIHRESVPSRTASSRLTWWNLRFVTRNPWFGIVPALAYLMAAWQNGLAVGECFGHVCLDEMGMLGLSHWKESIYAGVHSAMLNPFGLALYGAIFWGFVFFADPRRARFRYTVGTLHAMAHVTAGFLIYWFGAYAAITWLGLPPKSIPQYLVTGTIIMAISWIAGSIVLGVYLLVSLNVFGAHQNEAFSALRIQDWKGFLRMRIDASGALTIRFVGIERVPRRWTRDFPPQAREGFDVKVRDSVIVLPN